VIRSKKRATGRKQSFTETSPEAGARAAAARVPGAASRTCRRRGGAAGGG
jgi:hypothetical protein